MDSYGGVVAGASMGAVDTVEVQQTLSKDLRMLFNHSDSLRHRPIADPAFDCFAAFHAAVRDRM